MNDFVPLLKHNPSAQDPAVLEAITVQREPMIGSLVECVLDTDGGLRHQLLVGPRGMGKTHILSLVVSRVRAERDAEEIVFAWLDEDPWPIRSYTKFLAAIIARVAEEIDDSGLAQRAGELRSGAGSASLEAEEVLRGALAGRRLVLLVENLDEVFRRIGDDGQAKFRAFAEDWRQMLIFATSPQLFEGVRDHASPFYGFFAITHLDELSFESAVELMKRIAELHGDSALRDYLDSKVAMQRLSAVEALAGGHPRIWMLFAGCISIEAIDELVPLFLEALDDLTPYYQDRLREISDQQQELVVLLSEAGGALSNRALAERSGIAQNQIATMIRHLTDRGYIRRAEVPGDLAGGDARMSYWELREPLMRLCLDVKQSRGAPLRMIVEFLRAWYGPKLLDELTRLPPEARLANSYASEAFRTLEEEFSADDLFRGSPEEILARAEAGLSLRPDRQDLRMAKAAGLMMARQFAEAIVAIEDLLASADGADPFLEVQLLTAHHGLDQLSDPDFASKLSEVLDANRDDLSAVVAIAQAFGELGLYAEAYDAFTRASELDPAQAPFFRYRGVALRNMERPEEALEDFERAIELDPDVASNHASKGAILGELNRDEEALAALERAIELDAGVAGVHSNLGVALRRLGRPEDALAAFERAVALGPSQAVMHVRLGRLFDELGRTVEALAAYDSALTLKPDDARIHSYRGFCLLELRRLDDASRAFATAIKLDPDAPGAQNGLGVTSVALERYEEALDAFTRAAALDPSEAVFEGNRASVLGHLGRADEALAAFDRALEIEPESTVLHLGRADALEDLGRLDEAMEAVDMAAENDPENPTSHNARAHVLRQLGRLEEADRAVRRAIELDPDESMFRFTLAEVHLSAGDVAAVLGALRVAFETMESADQPGDTGLLCRILWETFDPGPDRRALLEGIVEIYATAGVAEDLGRGIVASIPLFVAEEVSLDRAEAWVEDWLGAPAGSELEIPLSLLKAALGWKRDRDRAHLLELPAEQRQILISLLRIEE